MTTFDELEKGDKVFLLNDGEAAENIKTLYVQSICEWDDYRETYALSLEEEEGSNREVHHFEVHGYDAIEEHVDDTTYTIATDKSLIHEMLVKKHQTQEDIDTPHNN